jgi:hypothetical protein
MKTKIIFGLNLRLGIRLAAGVVTGLRNRKPGSIFLEGRK